MDDDQSLDRWLVEAGKQTIPLPEVIATPAMRRPWRSCATGASGLEVFLLRRVPEMAFAAE